MSFSAKNSQAPTLSYVYELNITRKWCISMKKSSFVISKFSSFGMFGHSVNEVPNLDFQ